MVEERDRDVVSESDPRSQGDRGVLRLRLHLEEECVSSDPRDPGARNVPSLPSEPHPGLPCLPMRPSTRLPPQYSPHEPATRFSVMWGAGMRSLEQARPSSGG